MSLRPPYRPRNPVRVYCYAGCGKWHYRSRIDYAVWACRECLNKAHATKRIPCKAGCGRLRYRSQMRYEDWTCYKCVPRQLQPTNSRKINALRKRLDTEYMEAA